MDPTARRDVGNAIRTTNALCFAILTSIPIYAVVGWLVAGRTGFGSIGTALPGVAVWILAAIAVTDLALAQLVWLRMTRQAATKPTPAERLAAYRNAAVVAFALRESTAIIGLALTLLQGDPRWCLGLSALAALAMLLGWPRRADMARLAADPETRPIG